MTVPDLFQSPLLLLIILSVGRLQQVSLLPKEGKTAASSGSPSVASTAVSSAAATGPQATSPAAQATTTAQATATTQLLLPGPQAQPGGAGFVTSPSNAAYSPGIISPSVGLAGYGLSPAYSGMQLTAQGYPMALPCALLFGSLQGCRNLDLEPAEGACVRDWLNRLGAERGYRQARNKDIEKEREIEGEGKARTTLLNAA